MMLFHIGVILLLFSWFLGKGTAITLALDMVLADIQTKEYMMVNNHQQIVILVSDGKVSFYVLFSQIVLFPLYC